MQRNSLNNSFAPGCLRMVGGFCLSAVDGLLEEVDVYLALCLVLRSEFLDEVGEGGEGGGLVAEGGVFGFVGELGLHLADEGGEEFAYLAVVLGKECLTGGGVGLDGTDVGGGGLLDDVYHGGFVFAVGGGGLELVDPAHEGGACNAVLGGHSGDVA